MKRKCRKIGPLIIFMGIGVILAIWLPSSFCLFVTGTGLVVIGILIIRR